MPSVIIGADVCPLGKNRPYFRQGDAAVLFHDLLGELEQADLTIANLEGPFIERPSPIAKTGPVFGFEPDCIEGIRKGGIDVLCLANNHILDHGPDGLRHTMAVCERAGIATVGAGANLTAARQMLIRSVNGVRVGILAMAEHEFSIATRDGWGANPLDLIEFVRTVRRQKAAFDYLIVLVHGGDEFLVPSPRIQKVCRFLVEMGANAVIVQHPHCLGGCEEYQGGHIVYGQGALIMDEELYRARQSFHEGFLVKLHVTQGLESTMELIPFMQSSPEPGARRLDKKQTEVFHARMSELSRAVLDEKFVEQQWLTFCAQHEQGYISGILGHNRLLRKLNACGWLTRLCYGKKAMLGVRNLVCCETHQEALATLLNRRAL